MPKFRAVAGIMWQNLNYKAPNHTTIIERFLSEHMSEEWLPEFLQSMLISVTSLDKPSITATLNDYLIAQQFTEIQPAPDNDEHSYWVQATWVRTWDFDAKSLSEAIARAERLLKTDGFPIDEEIIVSRHLDFVGVYTDDDEADAQRKYTLEQHVMVSL